jgi:AcrR family transcriptional regulator
MTPERLEAARQLYDSRQHTTAEIAATLGVSRATIYRSLSDTAGGVSTRASRSLLCPW